MKKQLLLFILTAFGINAASAQPGFTCANSIQITALPYQTSNNTANFGDTYDVQQPTMPGVFGNYMSGNDVFYAYTATQSGYIDITLTPDNTWSGIFVYDGCENLGVNYVAAVANSGELPRVIESLAIVEGHTYIIAISTYQPPQTIGYSLSVSTTTICPSPTNLEVIQTSNTTAAVNWTSTGAASWEIQYWPTLNPELVVMTSLSSDSFVLSDLFPNNSYTVRVRSVCEDGTVTAWSNEVTFTAIVTLPPVVPSTTQFSTQQLVNDVLINNPCVNVTNITSSTGSNFDSVNGIGSFTNINPLFPVSSGILLSTGNANSVGGPNTSTLGDGTFAWTGDAQLEAIILAATGNVMESHNATKLEFDFTTQNEYMSFNFLFASEEYGIYQCDYSDAFAFLLTDIATGVTTNLAVVPNTAIPISVVTIRDDVNNPNCASQNADFFDAYYYDNNQNASATNFNGQTAKMTASAQILPNHPYHIKLVVADRGDNIFDSAVFIEAGTFAAGPPECMDKIKLAAFVDINQNGSREAGEPDFAYGSFVYQQNNAGDLTNISSPFGSYTIYDANPANTYDFSYILNNEFAAYFSAAPTSFNDINIPVGSGTTTLYFPIILTQVFNDVTVSIVPVTPPVPGIGYYSKVVYKNLGISPASGTINFTADPAVSVVSASPATNVSAGGFSYDFTNLQPYETRSINVHFSVPAIPVVNIDDLITDSVTISAPANDINISNNSFTHTQIAVASYDPNDKMESHGGKILVSGFSPNDYLTYTIRFQNTGTANAINVRLEDILDAQLDETSIRMVSASHNYIMERTGNQVIWKFDYIQLPGAVQNEELSKGYVTFMIKMKPGFAAGDIVQNHADIYFDANPAIVTNTVNTEFTTTLGTASFGDTNIAIWPNPASSTINIAMQNTGESLESIVIYDVLGKTVNFVKGIEGQQTSLNVSGLAKGVYVVEINTQSGLKNVKKLVIN